ncbi:3-deoxy-manno-octulosonate cytidylyltransferase [Sandarakinorhabdus sp.]|uniref:3-deoxy-manno-octulosonate cytidylyltransferase n=1 Tax=Sandarakinorhabdus sp. TaxID=1916663 RepID=UPI00334199B7
MARIALIIPARFASSRFPGKPLAPLAGPDGGVRTLLEWTWAAGGAVPGIAQCVVATDDDRIADHARSAGMAVIMTPDTCLNGTERCAAAVPALAQMPDIVVNLQGDAPLIPAAMVTAVIERLLADPRLALATAAVPASPAVLAHLQSDQAAGRVGGTTVVCDRRAQALYFSKSIIPHVAPGSVPAQPVLLHVGLYAYRPAALNAYVAAGPAAIELQEGLEQLRFLDAGLRVGVAICPPPGWDLVELNNPTDTPLIEAQLARRAAQEPA